MNFKVELELEGKRYLVLDISYQGDTDLSRDHKPEGKITSGIYDIQVLSDGEDVWHEWAQNPTTQKAAKLHFTSSETEESAYILELYDVHCLGLAESFSMTNDQPMTLHLHLSAGVVRDEGFLFTQPWHTTSFEPIADEAAAPASSEQQPRVIQQFLTDRDNNKISEYELGDTIILNMETENMDGNLISVKIEDHKYDFKYNGNVLKDDTIEDLKITGNITRAELEVIPQKRSK